MKILITIKVLTAINKVEFRTMSRYKYRYRYTYKHVKYKNGPLICTSRVKSTGVAAGWARWAMAHPKFWLGRP